MSNMGFMFGEMTARGVAVTNLVPSSSLPNATPGVVTLEQFGAKGDGVTNDQPAYAAALALLAASLIFGTGAHTIQLGSNRKYLIDGGVLAQDCALIGSGNSSILAFNAGHVGIAIDIGGTYARVASLRIEGDNTVGQVGIRDGVQGTPNSGFAIGVSIEGVTVEACATGIELNEFGAATHRGPLISGCFVNGSVGGLGGLYIGNAAEYTIVSACRFQQCDVGITNLAGNSNISACQVNDSTTTGIWIRGDLGVTILNDGHGLITGCTVNHATGDALKVDAIVNGMNILGCSFQGGTMTFTGSTGVHIKDCFINVTGFTFDGSKGTVFDGNSFLPLSAPTVANNANGHLSSTRWTPNNWNVDGTVPSWIYANDDGSGWAFPTFGALQLPRQPTQTPLATDPGGNVSSQITSPLGLGGFVWWVRADQGITLNAGNVASWADASGSGDPNRTLSQATPANQPHFNAASANYNGKPTVGPFNTSATLLASGVWSSPPPEVGTIFLVCDFQNAVAFVLDSLSAQRYAVFRNSTNLNVDFLNNVTFGAAPGIASRPCLLIVDMNGAHTRVWVNGLLALETFADPGVSSPTGITIGNAQTPGGVPIGGEFAEGGISTRRLMASPADALWLQTYVAQEYGIVLGEI